MKRIICGVLVGIILLPLFPKLVSASEARISSIRTVWENAWTLTSFHEDGKVNSTFFSFPKVTWNGSQWVDYIFNSSDMSGGIGSIYIKVHPTHTVIYDPHRTEERIGDERWMVEWYDESAHEWRRDLPIDNEVGYTINSSGVCFSRKSTLSSASTLEVYYMLKKGSKLKISVRLASAVSRKYRMVWKLTGIAGFNARWAMATESIENIPSKTISNKNCSSIQFTDHNNTKSLLDWFDTYWFNKATGKWETYFQELELRTPTLDGSLEAKIFFGNFSLSKGKSIYIDPTIVTFNSDAQIDGIIYKAGPSYPPELEFYAYTDLPFIEVGQWLGPGPMPGLSWYFQYRGYVSFNTASIPSLAYNLSAKLKLKTKSDKSNTDFIMKVMGGAQPLYGDSLETSDWGCGNSETAAWNTANYPGDDVYIDLTISSEQINKVGRTQFELKSNWEGRTPYGSEFVFFYSGDSPGNEPKLEVTYYVNALNINGTNWYYRNVSNDKIAIILFGGYTYYTYFVKINCVDHIGPPATEKSKPKIEFLD